MNSTHVIKPEILGADELQRAIQHLISNIIPMENEILKKKKKSVTNERYHAELEVIADRLGMISGYFFLNIKTNEKRLYEKIENSEQDYQCYINSIRNLTALITQDILNYQKVKHSIFAAERWVYIMKLCFEKNNFITCLAIAMAINKGIMNKENANIIDRLSPHAHGIISHINSIILRPKVLDNIQTEKFKKNELVLPVLTALHHLLEMIEQQPATQTGTLERADSDKYVERKKKKYSAVYENMQTVLKINLYEQDSILILPVLMKQPNDNLAATHDECARKIRKYKKKYLNTKLTDNLPLYAHHDAYYQHVVKFNLLTKQFTENTTSSLNSHERAIFTQACEVLKDNKTNYAAKYKSITLLIERDNSGIDIGLISILKKLQTMLNDISICETSKPLPPMFVPEKKNIIVKDKSENRTKSSPAQKSKNIKPMPAIHTTKHKRKSSRKLKISDNPTEVMQNDMGSIINAPILERKENPLIDAKLNLPFSSPIMNEALEIKSEQQNESKVIIASVPEDLEIALHSTIESSVTNTVENLATHSSYEEPIIHSDSVREKVKIYNELAKNVRSTSSQSLEACADDTLRQLRSNDSVKKLKFFYNNNAGTASRSHTNPELSTELQALLSARVSVRNITYKYEELESLQVRALVSPHREPKAPRASISGLFSSQNSSLNDDAQRNVASDPRSDECMIKATSGK